MLIRTFATVLVATASLLAQGPRPGGPGGPRPGGPGGGRTPATSATFTNFGTPCGADLNGTVTTSTTGALQIGLDVTNAQANAFVFVAMGQPATTPTPLPVGTCNNLLDRTRFFGGMFMQTDANGAASHTMRGTPPAGLNVSFQAVVMTFDRATNTRTVDASNGTTLTTQ